MVPVKVQRMASCNAVALLFAGRLSIQFSVTEGRMVQRTTTQTLLLFHN